MFVTRICRKWIYSQHTIYTKTHKTHLAANMFKMFPVSLGFWSKTTTKKSVKLVTLHCHAIPFSNAQINRYRRFRRTPDSTSGCSRAQTNTHTHTTSNFKTNNDWFISHLGYGSESIRAARILFYFLLFSFFSFTGWWTKKWKRNDIQIYHAHKTYTDNCYKLNTTRKMLWNKKNPRYGRQR